MTVCRQVRADASLMNTGLTVHDFLSSTLVRIHNRIPEALLWSEASNESLTFGIDFPFIQVFCYSPISLVAGEYADISFYQSRHPVSISFQLVFVLAVRHVFSTI